MACTQNRQISCGSMKPGTDQSSSDHYTGTVLPKVVAAVQEQRPNVGTTRTVLLHDNAAPQKARDTGQFPTWQRAGSGAGRAGQVLLSSAAGLTTAPTQRG